MWCVCVCVCELVIAYVVCVCTYIPACMWCVCECVCVCGLRMSNKLHYLCENKTTILFEITCIMSFVYVF